ncbi:Leucine-rich repeats and immunoglobulin-like domains protein 3 [Sarcoptes scabiei]|uniref:Leucine-rich repeats and immunoglobulin-like domains protein 3 n=1 Tax=Sarcoptes scabiei TaxID=52283 RepID=A0A834R5N6_SARSC|nr:Leucine-rich repeats and immunoglobulin-like domains protein 3 [Sarcoptes scabiei]
MKLIEINLLNHHHNRNPQHHPHHRHHFESSDRNRYRYRNQYHYLFILILVNLLLLVQSQCPWPRTPSHVSLHSDCVCGYSNVRRLSVQCSPMANFTQLLEVLNSPKIQKLSIDLLYINNASGLSVLPRNAFKDLDILQLHLTNTFLERIDRDAFVGLDDKLQSLTLQNTGLREFPSPIKRLRSLQTLDLSNNRISRIRPRTFEDLGRLTTLRLAFNNDLQLDRDAFGGLERSLKNLNLKGINLKSIPSAILNLTDLAFLDLAQNKIEDIKPRMFRRHHLLTALSLERNMIRSLHPETFLGLNESLSSLSLLNNMLVEFPLLALSRLTGLRVSTRASVSFQRLLTLLALDGNPLRTLSFQTFKHLNHSLRGLSVGGKHFECDCKIRWLAEWSLEYSLQITSRERNPQFCSKPSFLRNKPFSHIHLDDFVCQTASFTSQAPSIIQSFHTKNLISSTPSSLSPSSITSTIAPTTTTTSPSSPLSSLSTTTSSTSTATIIAKIMTTETNNLNPSSTITPVIDSKNNSFTFLNQTTSFQDNSSKASSESSFSSSSSVGFKSGTSFVHIVPIKDNSITDRNELIVNGDDNGDVDGKDENDHHRNNFNRKKQQQQQHHITNTSSKEDNFKSKKQNPPQTATKVIGSLRLIDVRYQNNNTVTVRWELLNGRQESTNGYQILYRYFGSKEFFRTEPLQSRTKQYVLDRFIKPNELLIVCVIDIDDTILSNVDYDEEGENAIPYGQCREMNTREPIIKKTLLNGSSSTIRNNHIGPVQSNPSQPKLSTSSSFGSLYPSLKRLNEIDKIVIGVSAAVCLFIIIAVLIFSCCFYRSSAKDSPLRTLTTNAHCLSTKSLSPLARSSFDHDWETVSVYSTKSIPRARITSPFASARQQTNELFNSDTIRSRLSNGYKHPVSRYIGSTLPLQPKSYTSHWIDGYMHHYPSVNNLPAITFGTTVTANGGGVFGGLNPFNSNGFQQPKSQSQFHLDSYPEITSMNVGNRLTERNLNRSKSKSRKNRQPKSSQIHNRHSKSHIDLRSNSGSNGSSNRLLLSSSTTNSYQSQNEYDSDHQWNNQNNQTDNEIQGNHHQHDSQHNHHSHHHLHLISSTKTNGSVPFSTSGNQLLDSLHHHRPSSQLTIMNQRNAPISNMNDNEVDIYIDKNYVKRFY